MTVIHLTFILSEYIADCLESFNKAVTKISKWNGEDLNHVPQGYLDIITPEDLEYPTKH